MMWPTCEKCGQTFLKVGPQERQYCSKKCEDAARKTGVKSVGVKRSRAQELRIAADLGGNRVPGSGAVPGLDGDVRSSEWLAECKTTTHRSFSITLKDWQKIQGEAGLSMRKPLMMVEIDGEELAVLSKEAFLDLIKR